MYNAVFSVVSFVSHGFLGKAFEVLKQKIRRAKLLFALTRVSLKNSEPSFFFLKHVIYVHDKTALCFTSQHS